MRAGRLDRLVTIQRKTSTPSDSGEPQETWATISGFLRMPAAMRPVKGDERLEAPPQLVGQEQVEFRVRYCAALAGLNPLDRVIHPALEEASPENTPGTRAVHDILAVHEIGRREGLQILTVRRADVTA